MFQSTLPHGERRIVYLKRSVRGYVSIHAPAWGATAQYRVILSPLGVFQSTLPHGERLLPASELQAYQEFQSTLPHGERLV